MLPIMFAIENVHGIEVIPHFSSDVTFLVVGGVVLTMVFQSITVGLVGCAFITTVGMVIQIQVLPQTLLSIVLFHNRIFFIIYFMLVLHYFMLILPSYYFTYLTYFYIFYAYLTFTLFY